MFWLHSISVMFSHGCSRIHHWSSEVITHQCSLWFVFFSLIKSIFRFKSLFQELVLKNIFGYFCFNCLVLMSWNNNYVYIKISFFSHNYHSFSNHSTSLFSTIYLLVSSMFFMLLLFFFLLFHAFNTIILSLKALPFLSIPPHPRFTLAHFPAPCILC